MAKGVLALNTDGDITYCTASEENRGKGRCNHLIHQENGEEPTQFLERCSKLQNKKPKKDTSGFNVKISSEMLDRMKDHVQITEIDEFNNITMKEHIKVENDTRTTGVLKKSPIVVQRNDGTHDYMFVKLDETKNTGNFKLLDDNYDSYHSSISESLASGFVSSLDIRDNFKSLEYEFASIDYINRKVTASLSKNFLYSEKSTLTENPISAPKGSASNGIYTNITHEDYEELIGNNTNIQSVFDNAVDIFGKYGVKEDDAKQFILNQAAFDLLVMNTDRKKNYSNIVFIHEVDEVGEYTYPLNMDYGRALVLNWNETQQTKIKDNPDIKEDMIEGMAEMAESVSSMGSIFDGCCNRGKAVDFLLENGFEPFKLNKEELDKNIQDCINKIDKHDKELVTFTKSKVALLNMLMSDKDLKRLIK